MNVIMLPIAELTPHPENPRRHPTREIEDLRESLRLYGFVRNIVVAQDKVILCGHGMVEAARQNGLTDAPCEVIKLPHDHPKAKKLMLLDNQVSRNAEDCDETIAALLAEIEQSGEGLPGTGYTAEDVDELIGRIAGEDEVQRPTHDALIESLIESEPNRGQSSKDGNWFYVEYYGQDERYQLLREKLGAALIGAHDINPDAFEEMVNSCGS